MLEVKEQCKGCFHFQVCANILKQQLFIREKMLNEENPKCEHYKPTADVAEVKRGTWVVTEAYPHWLCCSVCHKRFVPNDEWIDKYDIPINYCPNCGAKMDGGKEE